MDGQSLHKHNFTSRIQATCADSRACRTLSSYSLGRHWKSLCILCWFIYARLEGSRRSMLGRCNFDTGTTLARGAVLYHCNQNRQQREDRYSCRSWETYCKYAQIKNGSSPHWWRDFSERVVLFHFQLSMPKWQLSGRSAPLTYHAPSPRQQNSCWLPGSPRFVRAMRLVIGIQF